MEDNNLNTEVENQTLQPGSEPQVVVTPQVSAESAVDNPGEAKKPRLLRKVLAVFLIMLLAAGLLCGGALAYRIYNSPERLFKKVGENLGQVKAFNYSAEVVMKYSWNGDYDEFEFGNNSNLVSMKSMGRADFSNAKALSGEADFEMRTGGEIVLDFEARQIDNGLYVKMGEDAYGLGFSVSDEWILISEEELADYTESYGGVEAKEAVDIDSTFKELVGVWRENFPAVMGEELEEGELRGQNMRRFKYRVDEKKLREVWVGSFEAITGGMFGEVTEEMKREMFAEAGLMGGEIWIGSKDKLPHKITYSYIGAGGSESVEVSVTVEVWDINQEVEIEKPGEFKTIRELYDSVLETMVPDAGEQMGKAFDTQRKADLVSLTNAIYYYAAEHEGGMPEGMPSTETCVGTSEDCYDLGKSIVPTYIAEIPADPVSGNDENSGYIIYISTDGRIAASATGEDGEPIRILR